MTVDGDDAATEHSVLFVYYSYTQQTKKVVEAMAEVLRRRNADVTLAAIELTDPRYAARFNEFPMPHLLP
jgi:flavodoxin